MSSAEPGAFPFPSEAKREGLTRASRGQVSAPPLPHLLQPCLPPILPRPALPRARCS